MKKKFSILLVFTLVMVLLVGCGGDDKSKDPKDTGSKDTDKSSEVDVKDITFPLEETMELSMFAIMNGEHDLATNATMKHLEEITNVKWDVQSAMASDLPEKKGIMFSSQDYPDVLYKAGLSAQEAEKYGTQGVLIPLQDLIESHAPNLKKLLDERNAWQYITSSDGNVYALPEIDLQSPAGAVLFMNQEWLANVGKEEPTNLDELYDVLKAFKEQDANGNGDLNDEIPLMNTADATPVTFLLPYFGVPFDANTNLAVMDGEMTYVPTADVFKDFLEYITKLYGEGLLDKNSFTQGIEQQKAVGASGDVIGAFYDAGAFLTVGRERDKEYKILTPFEEGVLPVNSGVNTGTFSITDACENPEVAMAWIDQFYTEEGGVLAWLGVEGTTYKVNDDGTWEWILDGEYGSDIGTVRASGALQGAALHPSIQPDLWFTGMTDENEKYLTEERNRVVELGADPFPALHISDEDGMAISTIRADVDVYISQYIAQVTTGELELASSWDNYISTLEQMGVQKLIDIYKDAYAKTK